MLVSTCLIGRFKAKKTAISDGFLMLVSATSVTMTSISLVVLTSIVMTVAFIVAPVVVATGSAIVVGFSSYSKYVEEPIAPYHCLYSTVGRHKKPLFIYYLNPSVSSAVYTVF